MISYFSSFFHKPQEDKSILPLQERKLTADELLEKFNNDVHQSEMLYHCFLKSLGLIVIGGGIVAGIYIVRAAKHADATRDTSEDTGCYDSCGLASLGTWLLASVEGIGSCIVCCIGGSLMALNPSYGNDTTLIENLPNKIKLYINEFLASQNPLETINTVGELREYCERLKNTHQLRH
jgi:hypothetical protein